jgi:hypothetical protein
MALLTLVSRSGCRAATNSHHNGGGLGLRPADRVTRQEWDQLSEKLVPSGDRGEGSALMTLFFLAITMRSFE